MRPERAQPERMERAEQAEEVRAEEVRAEQDRHQERAPEQEQEQEQEGAPVADRGHDEFDVVVIGGGAAGLSGALVLARARRRVVVVDAGASRNATAGHVHGFLSRDGMPPAELLSTGRDEIRRYGGVLIAGTAVGVDAREGGFVVSLGDGRRLTGRRLLVTTGLRDELPAVPGVAERWGRDVLHCPYCHGREYEDREVAVLGLSSLSIRQALLVRQWTAQVSLVEHDLTPLGDDDRERLEACGIRVVPGRARRLRVTERGLAGAELGHGADGRFLPCAALFLEPTFVGNTGLLDALGCATTEHGWVEADDCGATSVPGVRVAGNVNDPGAQLISAAGDGARAAVALNADLLEEDVARTVATGSVVRGRVVGGGPVRGGAVSPVGDGPSGGPGPAG